MVILIRCHQSTAKTMNNKKWADENCKECKGTGEVTIGEFDDVENIPCVCASTNRAEYEAEMQGDVIRGGIATNQ